LKDPLHTESLVPEIAGLDLIDMEVTFQPEKRTAQSTGTIQGNIPWLQELNETLLDGYEIHAGQSVFGEGCVPWLTINGRVDGVANREGNVLGSYLHGLFDDGRFFAALIRQVRKSRGIDEENETPLTMDEFREREFDRIADIVRASVDMERVYKIVRGEV
jgi:adenosylcobyric acid synthase